MVWVPDCIAISMHDTKEGVWEARARNYVQSVPSMSTASGFLERMVIDFLHCLGYIVIVPRRLRAHLSKLKPKVFEQQLCIPFRLLYVTAFISICHLVRTGLKTSRDDCSLKRRAMNRNVRQIALIALSDENDLSLFLGESTLGVNISFEQAVKMQFS